MVQSRTSSLTVAQRVLPISPLASVVKQRYWAPSLSAVISTRRVLVVAVLPMVPKKFSGWVVMITGACLFYRRVVVERLRGGTLSKQERAERFS